MVKNYKGAQPFDHCVCPKTKQKLYLVDESIVAALNAKISQRSLQNQAGREVTDRVDGALLREDRKVAYLIRQGIPLLVFEEAIAFSS